MGASAHLGVKLPGGVNLPDRYLVHRRIATGGMASVWCAEDQLLGRAVAIKLLSEPYVHDAGAVLRFKREARAAARLSSHGNVVTIFDVGETAGGPGDGAGRAFIVMAYLDGGTVADTLRRGPVDRMETLRWVRETAAALDYAHERGVVHRDIKPENLLLDRGRAVHVADFGIARILTETPITQSGQVLGTAAYLAPERTVGEPATEASDRYSLAVVAFELLVGKRPFDAEALASQLRQHAQEEPPAASRLNPMLPPAVDPVLARGMAKRQHDRWPDAAAFAAALEDAATERASGVATRPLPIGAAVRSVVATPPNGRSRASRGLAASGAPERPRAAVLRPRPTAPQRPPRLSPVRAGRRRANGRVLAVLTLAAVLLAVALVVLVHSGGRPRTTPVAQERGVIRSRSHGRSSRATTRTSAAAPVSTTASSSPPSTSASSGSAGTQVGSASPQSADTLNAMGYELMQRGNYSQAIPLLQQAVARAPHDSLTYAYALYNLGASYVGAGEPGNAIPILRARLLIPNQTAVVQSELAKAEQAAGVTVSSDRGTPPAAHGRDHRHHGHPVPQRGD
jgi:eukaryotic-like serine/threonine-protein kinase